ncbi:hypothetical protein D3C78_1309530 [compost metagenome]
MQVQAGERHRRGENRVGLAQRFASGIKLGRLGDRINRGPGVEHILEALSAPGKNEYGEDDPRHPRAHHRRARLIAERGAGSDFFFLDFGVVDAP